MSESHEPEKRSESLWFLVIPFVVVICLWAGYWLAIEQAMPTTGLDDANAEKVRAARGQFGDMFGAASSLFSAFALAALIYTVWLQRKELQLQRKATSETQREMQLAREEATRQSGTAARTALIGALAALWEHYNAVEQTKTPSREKGDGDPKALKQELAKALLLLTRENMAANAIIFRSEQEIQSEAGQMFDLLKGLIEVIETRPPDTWDHATEVEAARAQILTFASGAVLHISPNSKASMAREELLLELARGKPGVSFATSNESYAHRVERNKEARAKALKWMRNVQSYLSALKHADYVADTSAPTQ